jgi:hypothetical protein
MKTRWTIPTLRGLGLAEVHGFTGVQVQQEEMNRIAFLLGGKILGGGCFPQIDF